MRLLTSPELGEPAETWEAWVVQLRKMSQSDPSVQFALQRAQRILDDLRSAKLSAIENDKSAVVPNTR